MQHVLFQLMMSAACTVSVSDECSMTVKCDALCQLAVVCNVTVTCDGLFQLVINAAWLLNGMFCVS